MSERYSKGGSRIYKYRTEDMHTGQGTEYLTDEEMEDIGTHCERYFGENSFVLHEIVSDVIHVDVLQFDPTPERNYYTLVTMGMSARPMNIPAQLKERGWEYAELMICLPPGWNFDYSMDENLSGKEKRKAAEAIEQYYWPVRCLKELARMPFDFNTWLGYQHSIPNGNLAKPYAKNTKLCGIILDLPVISGSVDFCKLKINEEKAINFYYLVPVYKEEMRFKLNSGADATLERIYRVTKDCVLDIKRKNSCR